MQEGGIGHRWYYEEVFMRASPVSKDQREPSNKVGYAENPGTGWTINWILIATWRKLLDSLLNESYRPGSQPLHHTSVERLITPSHCALKRCFVSRKSKKKKKNTSPMKTELSANIRRVSHNYVHAFKETV